MTASMFFYIFLTCIAASILVFFAPLKYKNFLALIIMAGAISTSSALAFDVLLHGTRTFSVGVWPFIMIDSLAAWFILIVNFTSFCALIYAGSYLKNYLESKSAFRFSLHYFAFLWLYFSMILLLMIQSFYSFLFIWEIMSITSFILVIWDAEDRETLKAGINYLIQMHVGFLLLVIGFLWVENGSGIDRIDQLSVYFQHHSNIPLFALLFIGFAFKAGLVPFHTWLPKAHPAAPSHVSAIMSGVMIKMGVFGIFRLLMQLQSDAYIIAVSIILLACISGIYAIILAIVQKDLKRVLAYSSIENISIILLAMGLGTLGLSLSNTMMAFLGFTGALLHVFNHSLFKTLLFFNAGSVYWATHTRNMNELGGLAKFMPRSATFFLLGAAAICALPPFNGFISEFFIFSGFFMFLSNLSFFNTLLIITAIIALALIGGLSVFAFVRAFSTVYLGQSRGAVPRSNPDRSFRFMLSQLLPLVAIFFIGFGSFLLFPLLSSIFISTFHRQPDSVFLIEMQSNLYNITLVGGLFIGFSLLLYILRFLYFKKHHSEIQATWGCGYSKASPALQYTAHSFSANISSLARPILMKEKEALLPKENEYFPQKAFYSSRFSDFIDKIIISKPIEAFSWILKKLSIMQTGQIQHYLLYAFVFMLLIFLLTYLNWI